MCGLVIDTDGDRITKIRGDDEDPFSRGHLCPKAIALQDLHTDPDWLRAPLLRRGKNFEEVSWETAIGEACARITAVQKANGASAVATYQGNPMVHNYGGLLFAQVFMRALGSRSHFSATSVDQLPQQVAACLMYGHQLLFPIPDIDRTHHFLILGANPLASNGSLMTAPGMRRRLQELKARGGRIVLVDPRRTETSALADLHLSIRPEADGAFLLALIHTVFEEGLMRLGRLGPTFDGIETLKRVAGEWSPESVADVVGIDATTIREEARAFAGAPTAVCYGRVGISTQSFGGVASWLMNALNAITGNLDSPGGFMFTKPAVDLAALGSMIGLQGRFGRRPSRVRGAPGFSGEWPAAILAEEIATPGNGQIRGLVVIGGNPVLSTPNGGALERALTGLDALVSIDPYVNETSRLAHVILPPASPLTRDHYDLVFHALAVRNTVKYTGPVFEPPAGALQDWEILLDLAHGLLRVSRRDRPWWRFATKRLRATGPRGMLRGLIRFGPHGPGVLPRKGLSLDDLDARPSGIDLGPLEPCLPGRLFTNDKRIRLAPQRYVTDLDRLKAWAAEQRRATSTRDTFALIGRREVRSNNSWMHNAARLMGGDDRCTLLMNPEDAARLGLPDGASVRVRSRVGEVTAPLEVSDTMRQGVVCLPHGFGHGREGVRLRVAGKHAGASYNDLSDDQRIDAMCGTAAFSGTPVTVGPA